jgi:hypothetical protein
MVIWNKLSHNESDHDFNIKQTMLNRRIEFFLVHITLQKE